MNYAQQSREELLREIDRLQQEKQQLKDVIAKFESAVGEGQLIVAQCDKDLRYEWIYNSHQDFFDQTVVGKKDNELNSGSGIEELMKMKQQVINTCQKVRREITFTMSDEKVIYYIMAKPNYNQHQEVNGVFTTSLDVTEFKKTQQKLLQDNKKQLMHQLSLGIAHQINNILAVIMGNTELVLLQNKTKTNAKQLSEKSINLLNNIKQQCNKAKRLIFDLNSMAENNIQRQEICSVPELIEEFLRNHNWSSDQIVIKKDYNPTHKLKVDKDKLQRAVANVLLNAYHAIQMQGQGEIIIQVTEQQEKIKVKIQDTGIGMAEEVQEKIFLPLYTTKGEWGKENKEITGMGLGLTIAEKIIQDHEGEIEFDSKPGRGSTFMIELPVDLK